MPRVPRLIVRAALVTALLGIVVLASLAWLLDPSAHKARIEETASRTLGMDISVNGPLSLRWRPRPHLVLRDVHARKHGADILVAREAVLGLELTALFGGAPRVRSVALHDGTFVIVRDRDGRFNFQ